MKIALLPQAPAARTEFFARVGLPTETRRLIEANPGNKVSHRFIKKMAETSQQAITADVQDKPFDPKLTNSFFWYEFERRGDIFCVKNEDQTDEGSSPYILTPDNQAIPAYSTDEKDISILEGRMQAKRISVVGMLAPSEQFLTVKDRDLRVSKERNIPFEVVINLFKELAKVKKARINGRMFIVKASGNGFQSCPWVNDKSGNMHYERYIQYESGQNYMVIDEGTNNLFAFSDLHIHLMEFHQFCEGGINDPVNFGTNNFRVDFCNSINFFQLQPGKTPSIEIVEKEGGDDSFSFPRASFI